MKRLLDSFLNVTIAARAIRRSENHFVRVLCAIMSISVFFGLQYLGYGTTNWYSIAKKQI